MWCLGQQVGRPGAGFTVVSLTLESEVMVLGTGSVLTDLDPESTRANQAPGTTDRRT